MEGALRDALSAEKVARVDGKNAFDVDGTLVFVKQNHSLHAEDLCRGELAGLEAIGETRSVRCPRPLAVFPFRGGWAVATEWLDLGFDRSALPVFGEQLARMHTANWTSELSSSSIRSSSGDSSSISERRFGFSVPTSCGVIPQLNEWCDDWRTFFIRCRLKPQVDRLLEEGGDRELLSLWPALQRAAESLLRPTENVMPSLVHGDLWNGNWAAVHREPVFFDPSASFSDSEFEGGIMKMFGGFGSAFWSAYEKVLPPRPGREMRIPLYELYHHLNHWNHFGPSYRSSSLRLAESVINSCP